VPWSGATAANDISFIRRSPLTRLFALRQLSTIHLATATFLRRRRYNSELPDLMREKAFRPPPDSHNPCRGQSLSKNEAACPGPVYRLFFRANPRRLEPPPRQFVSARPHRGGVPGERNRSAQDEFGQRDDAQIIFAGHGGACRRADDSGTGLWGNNNVVDDGETSERDHPRRARPSKIERVHRLGLARKPSMGRLSHTCP
jgi:hypothetical protein